MKLSYLFKGLPGHPTHPPLTDATIGAYTAATAMGFASVIGVAKHGAAHGWWLALIVGLIFTVPTAFTGFLDWLDLEWGSPIWRTATIHLTAMVTATVFFALAAIFGHAGYKHVTNPEVTTGSFILTVVGFCLLTLGGWLGGSIVYVHGMRVLNLLREPAGRAVSPTPKPEKEAAEGG